MNNKYKILLVEDEQNISTLVMTMLETAGYQVIPATLFRTKKGSENPFFLCMILFLSTGAHLSAPDACTIEKGVPPAAHFSHCTICVYFRTIYLIRQSLL